MADEPVSVENDANAAALVGYAERAFDTAEEVIAAANAGHAGAKEAVRTYARHLTGGVAMIVHYQALHPGQLIEGRDATRPPLI